MNVAFRLIALQFLQFFIWGSWLLTIGAYWFQTKQWSGTDFGAIFSTIGIAAIFMPAMVGIIADRFINAEKLFALLHLLGAVTLFYIPSVDNPSSMFWIMLINMIFYMPTISLSYSISYTLLRQQKLDIIKTFPRIRTFGTIGFICALWTVSLAGFETEATQFYLASTTSVVLSCFAWFLPKCPPLGTTQKGDLIESLGLKAFTLFKDFNMGCFFLFAMLLGAALQLTNAYGDTFLHDFAAIDAFKDSLAVKHPAIIMSISQISETIFILAIPFFLRHFGIKQVMLISMVAWALRFGLFAFGDPLDGLWMIILSCIIYGMAFDFFNIAGSMFIETEVHESMRASGQGLLMMMTNGFGALLGSRVSGFVIDRYFMIDGKFDWPNIWLSFAGYAAVIAVLFVVFFRPQTKKASAMVSMEA